MRTNIILYRMLVTVAVGIASIWAIYPPAEKIALGLDLKGGVHLVLRVRTDQAVQLETAAAAERLQAALGGAGADSRRVTTTSPTEFVLEGDHAGDRVRAALAGVDARFERTTIGNVSTFRMAPEIVSRLRDDTVTQVIAIIGRRVDEFGVAEPRITRYGRDDRILVELPGVTDIARAKELIQATAQLRLTLVESGPFDTHDAALRSYAGTLPEHLELLPGPSSDPSRPAFYVVRRVPAVAGSDLRDAQASTDEFNRPAVAFTLRLDAAQRFGAFTAAHTGRLLATVLDDRVTSVATIVSRITERGQIVGLSREEMRDQVIALRSGALPATLDYLEQHTVSATLGEASIRGGLLACAFGLAAVVIFMLAYYGVMGLNALVSIVMNLLILMALLAWFGAAMTLPGIAGLLLTIGMGVDSNVLVFERIREEAATAAGPRTAIKAGFDRVWMTIVDTHVASLIAAAFLFQFGTGPIRGFATTLTLGLAANVFTAVFVSRTLFELGVARSRRRTDARAAGAA